MQVVCCRGRCSSRGRHLSGGRVTGCSLPRPSLSFLRVLGLLDLSLQIPGPCPLPVPVHGGPTHQGVCGLSPAAPRRFPPSQRRAGCLAADGGAPWPGPAALPSPSPGLCGGLFHSHQFPEKTSHRVMETHTGFYLEEILEGEPVWRLWFTSEETEARKGPGCPPGHATPWVTTLCTRALHTQRSGSPWVIQTLCFLQQEADFRCVFSLSLLQLRIVLNVNWERFF